ncbi:hypothetical protein [Actinacidiphila glaucinigra]|nr:hypothetical protein [Actinacidiphila glaucinigra]
MTGLYALISPDGSLEFRDGVPDQMLKDAACTPPCPRTESPAP